MAKHITIGAPLRSMFTAIVVIAACTGSGSEHEIAPRFSVMETANAPGLKLESAALQRPLSPEDRIVVRDGHFYTQGRPGAAHGGERVRFFGVSLALSANFPSSNDGETLARRLADLGVNIVRIHAVDQPSGNAREGPVGVLADAERPVLDEKAVQWLARFIRQLEHHGIYVDLNLIANHTFPPLQKGDVIPVQSKPLPIFDAGMLRWQEEYVKNLLTALDVRGSPGLALVEINNESTLIDAWQEGALGKLVTGRFRDELDEQWRSYCKNEVGRCFPLPLDRSSLPPEMAAVAARFYVGQDQRYAERMVAAVRSVVGNDVPISDTQIVHSGRWNHGGFVNFDINRSSSFTDTHFYIDHYDFPRRQWDWRDWRISNGWLGDSPELTFLNIAFARVVEKPFIVSEFNEAWPNEQGSGLLPTITQFAISQDWDGLILYDYAHDRKWSDTNPSDFSLRGDLTKLVQFAQCAAYFRHIRTSTALPKSIISLSVAQRLETAAGGIVGNLANWLSRRFAVDPTLATRRRIFVDDGEKFGMRNLPNVGTTSYFVRNGGYFKFGSEYAAGISGFLPPSQSIVSGSLDITLKPGGRSFATAFLTTLDDRPLSGSRRLLLTVPGATMGTKNGVPQALKAIDFPGNWKTIPAPDGHARSASLYAVPGPPQMEAIVATVSLAVQANSVEVIALDVSGNPLYRVATRVSAQHVSFETNSSGEPIAAAYEILLRR